MTTPTYTCLHSPQNESRDKLDEKRMDASNSPKIDSLSCNEFLKKGSFLIMNIIIKIFPHVPADNVR